MTSSVGDSPIAPGQQTVRGVLIVSTIVASWLGMQMVHELGHVAGAWMTGGTVQRVVLHPLSISRTDVMPNPHPLVVVWAGPIVGCLLPIAIWGLAAWRQWPAAFLLRFFAGFCLVANGLYIGVGSLWGVGDCGVMLQHGSPRRLLWLFGVLTTPAGFALWHGQGKNFGLGGHAKRISARIAWGTFALAVGLAFVGLLTT